MIKITTANTIDIPTINRLANEIWVPTYKEYLPLLQITLMLEELFSPGALHQQMSDGHIFKLVSFAGVEFGFASYSETSRKGIYKLHRLYLHPKSHNLGFGRKLLKTVEKEIIAKGGRSLELNVNRSNSANMFYFKMGYHVVSHLDIPYHHYVLNDLLMKKEL